jgi:hypothetical protein
MQLTHSSKGAWFFNRCILFNRCNEKDWFSQNLKYFKRVNLYPLHLVSPTTTKSRKMEMYSRFYDEFHHAGEFNLPFDRTFLSTPQFEELTDRLHVVAAEKYRDSWVGLVLRV